MCLFSLASRKHAAEILEEEGEDDLEEEEDFSIRPASKRRRPYTPTPRSSPTGFLDNILGKEYSQVRHESEEEERGWMEKIVEMEVRQMPRSLRMMLMSLWTVMMYIQRTQMR